MITVTITEDTLIRFQRSRGRPVACDAGLTLFRQIAAMCKRSPSGKLRIKVKWTRLHQLWAATVYPEFYAWLREEGLAPQISMRSANLRIADLRSANLGGADLGGANLYGADLRIADLGEWERGADGSARRIEKTGGGG